MKHLLIIIAACLIANTSIAQNTDAEKARLFTRDSTKLYEELVKMYEKDQAIRENSTYFKANLDEARIIDSNNIMRMIAIVNTYGFPSVHRFKKGKKNTARPHIILVHAPEQYTDTIKKLIDAEKLACRISSNEYAHIDWHLNGRKGVPAFEGGKTRTKRNGTKVIRYKGL